MSASDCLVPPYSQAAAPRKAWVRLPILFGPLRGYRWLPASGGKVLRVLLGSYEREQTKLFQQLVGPGSRVLDIGAAHGYYTLLAAHLAGSAGRVIAFEPDAENAAFLREHLTLNRLRQATLLEHALGNREATMRFGAGTGSGTGRLCVEGDREVHVRRLDDVFPADSFLPTHLKIDVEGAELEVLRGGAQLIGRARPTIFLSTHGAEVHEQCCGLLADFGYRLAPIIGSDIRTTSELLAQST